MRDKSLVYVVDDEEALRLSLRLLLQSAGYDSEVFESGADFLARYDPDRPGCLIIDLNMPDMSGLELQTELAVRNIDLPLIMLSGATYSESELNAMAAGAMDFIEKPYKASHLLERVSEALEISKRQHRKSSPPGASVDQSVTGVEPGPFIHVVDDDDGVRAGTELLLQSLGWQTRTYASAEEFLAQCAPDEQGCLLLDLHMPGMNGVELQEELEARGLHIPVVIITAYRDDPLAVRAKLRGAVDILIKPFRQRDLQAGIERALSPGESSRH